MIFVGDHFREDGNWIWTSFCSIEKYLLGIIADGRGLSVTERFVNGELDKLAVDHVPHFTTDGYRPYRTVLLERYGCYVIGNRGRGRHGADRLVPPDWLNYAIVEKTREGKRLTKVRRFDVFGHVPDEMMNTSAVERQNLTIRLLSSRARRRSVTFGRSREAVQASLELLKANYNLCMPHSSLSLRGRENDEKHKSVTPAMRMGLTDHVWSIGELMSFYYRQNIN